MNKYILILACSLVAIPGFAQQVSIPTSQSITLPTSGSTTTQPALITPQDWLTFNSKQNALANATATQPGILTAHDWLTFNGKQNALGFTPENSVNKDKPNGYLGANANGHLDWPHLDNVPAASATTFGCLKAADWITFNAKQNALGYVPENPANKNQPNGYMGADGNGFLQWGKLSGIPQANASAKGVLSAADWTTFNAKQNALGYAPENPANKDQPKGYPSLDVNGKLPVSELPVAPIQVWNEVYQVPATPVATYTLLNPNVTAVSVVAYRNRERQIVNTDFSVIGNVVTFLPLPNAGDIFVFDYQHQ